MAPRPFRVGGAAPIDPARIAWVGSPNFGSRGGSRPIAYVIHTMGGFLAGTDAWFNNPASQVSSHFGVGLDGVAHQYVRLEDSAWANGRLEDGNRWPGPPNPNALSVSVETEDRGNAEQPVTNAEYETVLGLGAYTVARYPSIVYLVAHDAISPKSRPNCPGKRWLASGRFDALARALHLTAVP